MRLREAGRASMHPLLHDCTVHARGGAREPAHTRGHTRTLRKCTRLRARASRCESIVTRVYKDRVHASVNICIRRFFLMYECGAPLTPGASLVRQWPLVLRGTRCACARASGAVFDGGGRSAAPGRRQPSVPPPGSPSLSLTARMRLSPRSRSCCRSLMCARELYSLARATSVSTLSLTARMRLSPRSR